jgi:4-hydroxy-tetrahydrodipicolinate synthase
MFKGIATALITPFDEENKVNYEKLKELIEFQINNKISAIVICGTTGESSTLTTSERKNIIKFTIDTVNKRIPVIAGTGTNDTNYSIELSKYCQSIGVDGLLIVTPYYNKCTQYGLYEHYKSIANSVDIPIILYNVPSRTNINIDIGTVVKLSKIKNIIGIKEASGNISYLQEIINNVSEDFLIYTGNDDLILSTLALGGNGCISVLSNIFPKETNYIYDEFILNNIINSRKQQLKFNNLIKLLFIEPNPIAIKSAMNILNHNVGNVRLPLTKLTRENEKKLKEELKKISN